MAEFPYVRPSIPHFYRYGGLYSDERATAAERCSWLEALLLRHELFIPRASDLNDLRELRPRLAPKSEDELRTLMMNCRLLVHPHMSETEKASESQKLDDAIGVLGTARVNDVARTMCHEFLGRYRIYSMSKRWDNLSMWQWYGDKHRGYCLEFKNLPFFQGLREVVYVDEPFNFDWATLDSNLDVFFYKHRDWANEEEVRLLMLEGGPTFRLNPDAIARVILGKDMPENRAAQIREWGRRRQPPLPVVTTAWDPFDATLVIK